jgi:tripartite ATP-independent transporter DctP family solute receptor
MTQFQLGVTRRAFVGTAAAGSLVLAAPAIAQKASKTFVLSNHVPPSHNVGQASDRFAAAVKEKSGGAIDIQVRHAGQLAGLRAAAEGVQIGTIDMVWADLATLANWAPEYGFMVLPFLLNGFDQVNKVLDGDTFKSIASELRDRMRIEVLAYGPTGFRVMMNIKRPIQTADDMRGLKFRVPEIPVFVDTFKALGANPTPMAIGETYTALQTGVIDGMEAPADGLWSFKTPEVAKHASKTWHMFTDMNLLMSRDKFDALSTEEKAILRSAAQDVVVGWYRKDVEANDKKFWGMIAEKTQAVANPDIPSFKQKTASVYDTFYKQAGAKGRAYVESVMNVA